MCVCEYVRHFGFVGVCVCERVGVCECMIRYVEFVHMREGVCVCVCVRVCVCVCV